MIIAKQMIKTNQILSVGCSLSLGKVREKLWTNQQPSLKRYVKCTIWYKVYVCRKCVCTKYVFACTKWESTESTSSECFFYFPCQKKLKKPWRQGRVEAKLLELKHLLDQKNSPNEKPP